MGWFPRLRRKPEPQGEKRGNQEWMNAFLEAQEQGLLRTSMPSLREEQVSGSYMPQVKNNSPVFALMQSRMQVFSQATFQWARVDRGEVTDLFGSRELELLERPWPGGTTADLLARMEMDVTGFGNAYIRRVSRQGEPSRLVRLRPDWVSIILGSREDADHPAEAADVELVGYAYAPRHVEGDRVQIFGPNEVAHYAPIPDPELTFVGMSWITPVIRDVLGDSLQTDHKRAFLRNAATPNLVLKFPPEMGLQKVQEFKELFDQEHRGTFNAYKTLFLGGGADPIPVGKDFQELDFAVTQGKAESRLAAAAGVPPSWVGFSEGLQGSALNAGNFTAARRRFGDGTMHHLWSNAAASLETIVNPPDNATKLWFATRSIPFLRMDAEEQSTVQREEAATIVSLVRDGFNPESAIDAVVNRDWERLQHTGLLSVQMHPPGEQPDANSNGTDPETNGDGDRSWLIGRSMS